MSLRHSHELLFQRVHRLHGLVLSLSLQLRFLLTPLTARTHIGKVPVLEVSEIDLGLGNLLEMDSSPFLLLHRLLAIQSTSITRMIVVDGLLRVGLVNELEGMVVETALVFDVLDRTRLELLRMLMLKAVGLLDRLLLVPRRNGSLALLVEVRVHVVNRQVLASGLMVLQLAVEIRLHHLHTLMLRVRVLVWILVYSVSMKRLRVLVRRLRRETLFERRGGMRDFWLACGLLLLLLL